MTTNATRLCANCAGPTAFVVLNAGLNQSRNEANTRRTIFGMIQCGGEGVIKMLANVQQQTIKPIIQATVSAETLIYTDEYDIYARLEA
ncbi:MAG: ISXO2-like transposase domain [Phormidesmis priestleyi Ana]|uniref:ISXO2-like transposase domain n=1 Tax=Phormidesmis priestleyi Ana TaxID=1666911 RepID=A0A0P7ZJ84_9CYAN|nr:MAG: ISXO2-like transposase domain [Phormidesmis priestleyi Ana]